MHHRRQATIIGATATLGLALALSACSPKDDKRPSLAGSAADVAPNLVQRVRVLAPDALTIDGTHVRLAGVYAPQGVPDARCWAEALANKQATATLRQMVAAGHSITFTPTSGEDEFTRKYAKVTLNGADLGETLFDEGLVAHSPPGKRFNWCGAFSEASEGGPDVVRSLMDPGG